MGGKTKLSAAEYHRQYRARKAAQRAAGITPAAKQSTTPAAPGPVSPAPQSKATPATQPPSHPAPPVALDDAAALWLDDPPSPDSPDPTAAPHSPQPSGQPPAPPLARSCSVATSPDSMVAVIAGGSEAILSGGAGEAGEGTGEGKAGEAARGTQGQETRGDAKQAGRGEPAPVERSHTRDIAKNDKIVTSTPECYKNVTIPLPGTIFRPQKFAMPPVSDAVFDRVLTRMLRGDYWRDIARDESICWEELRATSGQDADHWGRWIAVDAARRASMEAEIRETGHILLAAARAELPSEEEETDDGQGGPVKRKRKFSRAAAAAQAGAALLMPSVHGRAAARGPQINVNGNAAIFGGPPPANSLDDFDGAGMIGAG